MPKFTSSKYIAPVIFLTLLIALYFAHFRIDLTSDKRYSLSDQTKNILKKADDNIKVKVYLTGDLNPGFTRLKKSTVELLEEMNAYSPKSISIEYVNPSEASSSEERNANYNRLSSMGMKPTAVYERDDDGKSVQKIIFPYIVVEYKNKTADICLLKNVYQKNAEENLNISIENLEFEIADGIRRLLNHQITKIAFLEGHGELSEAETWDISKSLSRYFQIDRGTLTTDAAALNPYKLIIVAKPRKAFSETDKFILDQYIMNGGKVIWLIDGVQMETENLSKSGTVPAMALDINLGDMFFKYGVRINPVILEDVQCQTVPINIAPKGEEPQFEPTPLLYSPLLLTSPQHPVTKNISQVRAEICSSIDIVANQPDRKSTLLLATSDNSHIIPTPVNIDLGEVHSTTDKTYFNTGYVPVAVLMEGQFESDFENRMLPKVSNMGAFTSKSVYTSQLFIADGDIIKNETNGIASDSTTLELGLDRYSGTLYGNRDFLVNAVLFMTDEGGLIQLKSKTLQLRLLNKGIVKNNKLIITLINVGAPLLLLLIGEVVYSIVRRRKYSK